MKSKIEQWAPAFASYLIHIYTTKYDVEEKIPEPMEVKMSTNKYRKDQDVLREYFDGNIDVTDSKKDCIKKRDLYTHFKLWFREIHDGSQLPKSKKLYEFIEKELKTKYTSKGWMCIKFISNDSDSDDESENFNHLDM